MITKIILTGGPCSGKSSALSRLRDEFEPIGWKVFIVPESATLLFGTGINLGSTDVDKKLTIQSLIMKTQIQLERTVLAAAKLETKNVLIVCDRGAMDGKAFMSQTEWQTLLDENMWSTIGLRDKHYDAVIHLVTAADGAKEFYTLANNAARTETAEQAVSIDRKLKEAWTGHPHLRVIDNSTNFENKLKRVFAEIKAICGIPQRFEIEKKYLVETVENITVPYETIEIEQTYLDSGRIRKRGQNGVYTYYLTHKTEVSPGIRTENEIQISPREYALLLNGKTPQIRKTRTCFLYKDQYFELDEFLNSGLKLLEIELNSINAPIILPDFIKIKADVTNDHRYTNRELAKC